MKKIKTLKFLSFVFLIGPLSIQLMSLMNRLFLFPFGICHEYNGDSFGEGALCIVPAITYFGSIFMIFLGPLGFIGMITLALYFVNVFLYNKKNIQKVAYSKLMLSLAAVLFFSLFLAQFFVNVANTYQEKRETEEFLVPTENHFVCGPKSGVTIEKQEKIGNYVARVYRGTGNPAVFGINYDAKSFNTDNYGYKREGYERELNDCLNIAGKSVYDIYSVPE